MRNKKFFSKKNSCRNKILSNNKGSAMITALVVGIVIFGFCLSMLLVAYTLFAQTSRSQVQLGCKNVAQSTAEEIGHELESPESELSKFLLEQYANFKAEEDEKNAGNIGDPIKIDKKIKMSMSSSDSSLDRYDVFVTFNLESKSKVETDIECFMDYGNFKDVQSYTVHTEYKLP